MANNELLTLDDVRLASIMNKRHRSAAKSFKSPPQPRFCIKESLEDGRDVFINVLSYSRIANQLSELDPVPLYGGMIIKSYSSLKNSLHQQQALQAIGNNVSPPPPPPPPPSQLIFAVMASPDVLKKVGRNFPDSPEQMNLIELMCEFCEAMNPGLKLSKKPQILKDRDLQGELKDIWTAVQNFREKEKSGVSDIVVYTEFGPDSAAPPLTPFAKDIDPKSIEACIKSSSTTSATTNSTTATAAINELKSATSEKSSSPKGDTAELTTASTAATTTEKMGEKTNVSVVDGGHSNSEVKENDSIEIEKLSIGDKKSTATINSGNSNNGIENESSEKNIKVQNQKNKESQHHHHFFPKFLSSSKEKDKDTKDKEKDKDKEKEKEKAKGASDESGGGGGGGGETKVKTKKSLNFFRRNKTATTGSPTHNNNSNSNANNIANE